MRSDIPCGSKLCDKCDPFYAALDAGEVMLPGTDGEETRGIFKTRLMPILSQRGRESGGLRKKGHYLIIDTNVALHQVIQKIYKVRCPLSDLSLYYPRWTYLNIRNLAQT